MARDFLGTDPGITIDGEPVYAGYQTSEQTSVDTTLFDNNLDAGDDTVQKCLNKLDDVIGSGGFCNIDGGAAATIYGSVCNIDGGGA